MNMHSSSQAGLDFSLPCIGTTAAISTIQSSNVMLKIPGATEQWYIGCITTKIQWAEQWEA